MAYDAVGESLAPCEGSPLLDDRHETAGEGSVIEFIIAGISRLPLLFGRGADSLYTFVEHACRRSK